MSRLFYSDEDFAHARRYWVAIGILAGFGIATAILLVHVGFKQPLIITGAPQILKQTDTETVARIPTLRGGQALDCTLTIDHKHRAWSLSC